MKLKDLRKNVSAKRVPLEHLLKKNEKIKRTVKKAASELTLVNEVADSISKCESPRIFRR